jgi:hypothetical protein
MAKLGCRQAERLLWVYLEALGESGRTHGDFVRAIQTGPTDLISVVVKRMKLSVARVGEAREAFQEHNLEHKCCPDSVISTLPSPPPIRAVPSHRKRRLP